ncbi:unnamed protein product [Polarella glacialis]|uniref:Uncharacterized protein n=1 Tax=Polarella glacialis TaxID=89957 RepID=A0A813FA38_POLGL|nr:unnamed protein product [Polarella glacialis]
MDDLCTGRTSRLTAWKCCATSGMSVTALPFKAQVCWQFAPKIGGDAVWAYNPDLSLRVPPATGWRVPYNGLVDPTFRLSFNTANMDASALGLGKRPAAETLFGQPPLKQGNFGQALAEQPGRQAQRPQVDDEIAQLVLAHLDDLVPKAEASCANLQKRVTLLEGGRFLGDDDLIRSVQAIDDLGKQEQAAQKACADLVPGREQSMSEAQREKLDALLHRVASHASDLKRIFQRFGPLQQRAQEARDRSTRKEVGR